MARDPQSARALRIGYKLLNCGASGRKLEHRKIFFAYCASLRDQIKDLPSGCAVKKLAAAEEVGRKFGCSTRQVQRIVASVTGTKNRMTTP
ncbi:MAG: hypothetical protein ACLQU2_01190 [Candidatus Binataceae bacterium]